MPELPSAPVDLRPQPPDEPLPLRLGAAEDFGRVETLLQSCAYNEEAICPLLSIQTMADLSAVDPKAIDLQSAPSQTLALLVRIFLFSELVPGETVEKMIDPATLNSLLALDIVRRGRFDAEAERGVEMIYSPVFLYPVAGLVIASDRHNNPDGSPFTAPADIVFPAINAGTLLFLKIISKSPVGDVLDICSGSGVAALLLGKSACHVVASDITSRAAHFAGFNKRLNHGDNVEILQGDLYSAVAGRSFDRIVAHPPYVPSLSQATIYRDGGETGELLVRQIIAGLPRFLRPGGTYYSICVGLDTQEGSFAERARRWLGEDQRDFDITFAVADARSPEQFARETAHRSGNLDPMFIRHWQQVFAAVGAQSLVYGALVIHRHAAADRPTSTPAFTRRLRLSEATEGACFDWMLKWRHWADQPDALERLAQMKPCLSANLQVKINHIVKDRGLVVAEIALESQWPFPVATQIDAWLLPIIAEFNGDQTTLRLFEKAQAASALPPNFSLQDFAGMVATLIERGYLETGEVIS